MRLRRELPNSRHIAQFAVKNLRAGLTFERLFFQATELGQQDGGPAGPQCRLF